MSEQHTAFYLSLVLVILNSVQESFPAKSAKYNRLKSVNKEVSRVVDFFRPEGWGKEDLDKACIIIERIDVLLKELYPGVEDHVIEYQI